MSDSSNRWSHTPLGIAIIAALVTAAAGAVFTPAGATLWKQVTSPHPAHPTPITTPTPGARGIVLNSEANKAAFDIPRGDERRLAYGVRHAIGHSQYPDSVVYDCAYNCNDDGQAVTFQLGGRYHWLRVTTAADVRADGSGGGGGWATITSGDVPLGSWTLDDQRPHSALLDVSGLQSVTLAAGPRVGGLQGNDPVVVFGSPTLYR